MNLDRWVKYNVDLRKQRVWHENEDRLNMVIETLTSQVQRLGECEKYRRG